MRPSSRRSRSTTCPSPRVTPAPPTRPSRSRSRAPRPAPRRSTSQTADGSATAPDDYASQSGTLTFAEGVLTQTVTVAVAGDTARRARRELLREPHGLLAQRLDRRPTGPGHDPRRRRRGDPAARRSRSTTCPSPRVTPAPPTRPSRSRSRAPRPAPRRSTSQTADGSATAPDDYASQSGTLTFAEGVLTQTVTVAVAGDTLDEPDESFFVNLTGSSPNVSIADPQGQGTILDDGDGVIPPPEVSIDDVVRQPRATPAPPTRPSRSPSQAPRPAPRRSTSQTADGSATAPDDYASQTGTLTFAAGRAHPDRHGRGRRRHARRARRELLREPHGLLAQRLDRRPTGPGHDPRRRRRA